ncbi:hypothetical protein BABINDRAFT_179698 [Babjeviella inositovora NRRL Y-12698]|uniref:DNA primase large subunit n=1 Tax=Babjeviella inositovora NRRL Y-12698 TaxID=984486 RepID=A0A1E3QTV0_9ASCO|nr:uncharacterized protein BABINDRAFT_179698 [Babjeviella inositovora NRRL Y-12698]ODQ81108.1 hypothetical protein BABINDRAFT_179698 [Babjeviella inositovora NRRL Y-12698]
MFRQTKRRTDGRKNYDAVVYQSSGATQYNSRLSFYAQPPLEEITLEEFETWAIDRLKVLIEIESSLARTKSTKDIEAIVKPLLAKLLPLTSNASDAVKTQERKKDHYSHYILRLVFCRTEDLRKKFIRNELMLFKIRYALLSPQEQKDFVNDNRDTLPWDYLPEGDRAELAQQLYSASQALVRSIVSLNDEKLGDDTIKATMAKQLFIMVPFEKVPDLVASRMVLIRKGNAYIPSMAQLSLLAMEYTAKLDDALVKTFRALPRLDEDDRLVPLLNHLSTNFSSFESGMEFGTDAANTADIQASTVGSAKIMSHMPLCATNMLQGLFANHHMKYTGRQQLGVFLKGIGLNVDEALKFWQDSFCNGAGGMTSETFNKEYKYNIRHMYGLEGGRINYKPWNCSTVLAKPKPSKGEFHGCPYRDFHPDKLVGELNSMGINDNQDITAIMDDVAKTEYTIACTRVFELTHKNQMKGGKNFDQMHINHPNLYFDRSRQLERAQGGNVN